VSTPASPIPGDTDRPLRDDRDEPEAATIDDIKTKADVALFEGLRDRSSVSAKRVLNQVFERELDELTTPAGSAYFSDQHDTKAEEEAKQREEKLFMAAVAAHADRSLRTQGIRVAGVTRDAGAERGGGEYVLKAKDGSGRHYEAKFGLFLLMKLQASGGDANLVERTGLAVAREIYVERDNYFRRAGLT
jgi:hypothetical protein